jgi:hypothetical protein
MRRTFLLVVIGLLAIVGAVRLTAPSLKDQNQLHASAQFRTQAQSAFDAIKRCDDYRAKPAIYYEPRLLEAETALDSLRSAAKGTAEENITTILFNYLIAVKRTRIDWQYSSAVKKAELERDEDGRVKAYIEAVKSF